MTFRAIIVDDEPLARRAIRHILDKDESVETIAECGDGLSAVRIIRERDPNIVFLDVQMPEMNGFDVIREIGPDKMPVTVFVTAYDRYALRAFESNATDYLLKPFGRERFNVALTRAKERVAGKLSLSDLRLLLESLSDRDSSRRYLEHITVADKGRIILVKVDDVDWIGAAGNYAEVHVGSKLYEIRQTLTHVEEKLDPAVFLRIHRSTIVNLHRIREIQTWFHGHHVVVLKDGQELRMSRYQRDVAQRLGII